jgi:hypothetical protein
MCRHCVLRDSYFTYRDTALAFDNRHILTVILDYNQLTLFEIIKGVK